MSSKRSFLGMVGAAGVLIALAAGSTTALARDVYWSVGVNSPGVSVGVGNGYPVIVAPAPVYYAPPPPPPPVYYAPPRPVYYAPPAPVYYGPPRGHWRGHHHHGGHRRDHWRY